MTLTYLSKVLNAELLLAVDYFHSVVLVHFFNRPLLAVEAGKRDWGTLSVTQVSINSQSNTKLSVTQEGGHLMYRENTSI